MTPAASDGVHPEDYPRARVCAGILAGGQGRRMGGADKGLVELAGRPMVLHVISALQAQAGSILISANRNLDRYGRLGYPVLPDRGPGFAGPLAGMAALMVASDAPWLLVVPCDSPFLPPDLGPRLWRAARASGADAAVVQVHGRLQPVFALLRGSLRQRLLADVAAGWRKAGAWLRAQDLVAVDFSDHAERFFNVNTAEQHQWLVRRLDPANPVRGGQETP
ncbi:MAG: molybdenum cofactor guanylyltransferase [Ottowia sp.]|nr:molybdenum cofactor guanylyltransferase [Ottowia sp.]